MVIAGLSATALLIAWIRRRSVRTLRAQLDASLDAPVPVDRLRVETPEWDASTAATRPDLSPTSLAGRMARIVAERPRQEAAPESADVDEVLDLVAIDASPDRVDHREVAREAPLAYDLGAELLASLEEMLTEAVRLGAPWSRWPSPAKGPRPVPLGDGSIGATIEPA